MNEAYRIGVMIAMTSNAEAVLGAIGGRLMGLRREVRLTEDQMKALGIAAVGAVAIFTGVKVIEGVWKIIDAGRELNKELEKTKQLGGSFADSVRSGAALAADMRTQLQVPTSTSSENERMRRELGTQLQNPEAAAAILPFASKAAFDISHFTGESTEDIIKNLVKAADIRGRVFSVGPDGKEHVDPAKFQAELEAAVKGLILGGGYLKSNDILQLAIQGGLPAKFQTPEVFYSTGVELAVSQRAGRAGTEETALMQQLVGGTMMKKTAVEMERLGLLHHGEWKSEGGHVVVSHAATKRFEEAMKDPMAWIAGPLADIFKKRGLTGLDAIAEVAKLFGRQTTQRMVAEVLSNAPQFQRARDIYGNVPGVEQQYKMLINEDLDTNIKAFSASWTTLLEALGNAGIPTAIKVMHEMTGAIQAMSQWAAANPNTAKVILDVAAAIGVGLVIGGTITLVAAIAALAGPAAGVAVAAGALAALGAAIATFGTDIQGVLKYLPSFLQPQIGPDGKPVTLEQQNAAREKNLWKMLHPDSTPGIAPAPTNGPMNPLAPGYRSPLERLNEPMVPPPTRGVTDMSGPSEVGGDPAGDRDMINRYRWKGQGATGADTSGYTIQLRGDVNLDGRKVGSILADQIGRELAAPPPASAAFDNKAVPAFQVGP